MVCFRYMNSETDVCLMYTRGQDCVDKASGMGSIDLKR